MKIFLNIIVLISLFTLNNCVVTLGNVVDYINYSKTAADIVTYSITEKTTSDHALSYMLGKDCSLARSLKLKAICNEIQKNQKYKNNHLKIKKKSLQINRKYSYQKKKIIKVPSMAYDFK
tara:strand:+ start:722 stop:1081 length:360 start_codon:yes stop_codon:yes gene_type:complete